MQATTPLLLDGASLSWWWSRTFIGLLLTIATGPLLFPRVWSGHYGKMAAGWAALTVIAIAFAFERGRDRRLRGAAEGAHRGKKRAESTLTLGSYMAI